MINNLKKQISNFKQILKIKEEEISNMKNSSKIAKYVLLEQEYKIKSEEAFSLKELSEKQKEIINL